MAKTEKTERGTPANERQVYSGLVAAQYGDIFKVLSKGTCIEYTDRFLEAQAAYKEANVPKEMFKIFRDTGAVQTVFRQTI